MITPVRKVLHAHCKDGHWGKGAGGWVGIGIPSFIKKNWGFGFQSIVLYSLILL